MERGDATSETVTVLYVDDDAERRSTFSESLTAFGDGFAVETADGPGAALDRVESEDVDCLVTAADPSDGSAFDLLADVRAVDVAVPVVFFALDGSERFAAKAVSSDVDGYVSRTDREAPLERLAAVVGDAVTDGRRDGSAGVDDHGAEDDADDESAEDDADDESAEDDADDESDEGGVSDERSESEARETDASPGARFEFRGVEFV